MVKAPEFTHDELEALCYSVSEGDAAKWKALRSGLDKLTEYVNAHRLARDDKASKRVDSSRRAEQAETTLAKVRDELSAPTFPQHEEWDSTDSYYVMRAIARIRALLDDGKEREGDAYITVKHVKAFVGVMIKRAESGTLPLEELHALSDLIDKVLEREPRNGGDKN